MTTDQPQWMKNVAAAHAERRLPPKVAADQPTPTSSLEEARDIATLDAEWWEAHNHLYRERRIHPSDADHDRATMTRTRLAMDASIRADYEELVRAARESHPRCEPWDTGTSRAGQACLTHDSRWPDGALDCGADAVNTALTRIEESLGGRKDG